jgi:phosphoglycolate phosphatase-like HAD superfamily hydrolase
MTKLVLFDIDGTLLDSGGAGRRAMITAFDEVFGTTGPIDKYRMAGKVDPQIVIELMTAAGLPSRAIHEQMPTYFATYTEELQRVIDDHAVRAYPGVVELLDQLTARPDIVIGLLTGNIWRGAQAKLKAANLARYFDGLGAFGDDALSRPELPAIAVRRAEEVLGQEFRGKDVIIVGDTPADIDCGRALGVKSIAVATGPYACEELREHRPDFCFPDLSDTEAIVVAILDG